MHERSHRAAVVHRPVELADDLNRTLPLAPRPIVEEHGLADAFVAQRRFRSDGEWMAEQRLDPSDAGPAEMNRKRSWITLARFYGEAR